MDDKKISTGIGVMATIIIAITVYVLAWNYYKKNDYSDSQQVQKIAISGNQSQPKNSENKKMEKSITWHTFENSKYNFKVQYPSNYLLKEEKQPFKTEYDYNLQIGLFTLAIFENEAGIENFIEKQNMMRAEIERTSESLKSEKIANIDARIIKSCDLGGYCAKSAYFINKNYIIAIYLKSYFVEGREKDRENLDKIIESLEFF